jgi:O-antigen ligase
VGLAGRSQNKLNKATSGRVKLTEGALAMARDRPVWGYGSGSFADEYRERRKLRSHRSLAESHTIPLTVAAEQGAVGFVAYLALLVAAFGAAFAGLRRAIREGPDTTAVAAAAVAAALTALVVHTLGYAAFLEDPVTWALLAVAAALGAARRQGAAA